MKTQVPTASHDSLLARVLDGYLSSCRRGERPDSSELIARHPEIAAELETCLASLQFIHHAGQAAGLQDFGHVAADDGAAALQAPTLGDFRILRQIGRGGMGVVYEAEQISLHRRVALKTLPFAGVLDRRQLARFKNEALAAAAMQHPNIVPVYAVGPDRGVHYYAMQYIPGQNLAELIRELRVREGLEEPEPAETEAVGQEPGAGDRGPEVSEPRGSCPSPAKDSPSTLVALRNSTTQPTRKQRQDYYREVARIGMEVAEALAHAHAEGVIHRDIKPSNLLLDEHGKIWITDFGLAQTRGDSGLTMTGDLVGTLRYMSPEQALGKGAPIDHRTDIYSFGATLYEMFTLQPVLAESNRQDLLRRICFDEPVPMRARQSEIPLELETVILKTLSKDPRDRYASAMELHDDLQRFLSGRSVLARRLGRFGRIVRWSQRHALLLLSLLILVVVILGSMTASLTLALNARREAVTQRDFAQKAAQLNRVQFEQAFVAIDAMVSGIEEDIATKAGDPLWSNVRQATRERIWNHAIEYYRSLIDEPRADKAEPEQVGIARVRLGRTYALFRFHGLDTGKADNAEQQLNAGIGMLDRLPVERRHDPFIMRERGLALYDLSRLLTNTTFRDVPSTESALHAADEAVRSLQLAAATSGAAADRVLAARAMYQHATLLSQQNKHVESVNLFRRAAAVCPPPFSQNGDAIRLQHDCLKAAAFAEEDRASQTLLLRQAYSLRAARPEYFRLWELTNPGEVVTARTFQLVQESGSPNDLELLRGEHLQMLERALQRIPNSPFKNCDSR